MAGKRRCRKTAGGSRACVVRAAGKLAAVGLTCCWLIFASLTAVAETVYKWIDENGVTHYGQLPPPASSPAQQIDLPEDRSPTAGQTPGYQERLERINRRLQVYDEERRIKQEREAEVRQARARRDQQCARLRAQVRNYETRGGTWYELDDQGSRSYLDDQQLADRIRQLHEVIDSHCR
jgi:hypothetical protein